MIPEDLYNYFGSGKAICEKVGINLSLLGSWMHFGRIPYRWQKAIERMTNGDLKAPSNFEHYKNELKETAEQHEESPAYVAYYNDAGKWCRVVAIHWLKKNRIKIVYENDGKRLVSFDHDRFLWESNQHAS